MHADQKYISVFQRMANQIKTFWLVKNLTSTLVKIFTKMGCF